MHWRNWIFLGIAATIAVIAIESARHRADRHSLEPDDRKPAWYDPKDTGPVEKKRSEPIGPG